MELLASSRMDYVMSALSSAAAGRIVLMDSSPLLLTSEAKIIASVAGQIVLVVHAEETEQDTVERAIETLDENKAVSLLLNKTRTAQKVQLYGFPGEGEESTAYATDTAP